MIPVISHSGVHRYVVQVRNGSVYNCTPEALGIFDLAMHVSDMCLFPVIVVLYYNFYDGLGLSL